MTVNGNFYVLSMDGFRCKASKLRGKFFKDLLYFYGNVFSKHLPYEPFYVMEIHQVVFLPGHKMDHNIASQIDFPL